MSTSGSKKALNRRKIQDFDRTNVSAFINNRDDESQQPEAEQDGNIEAEDYEQDQPNSPQREQDTQARCNLTFEIVDKPPIDRNKWTTEVLLQSLEQPIAEFDKDIKNIVVRNLEQDGKFLNNLRQQRRLLVYHLHIPHSICDEATIDPLNTEHEFATVGDLLVDPSKSTDLAVTVNLTWEKRTTSNKNQKNHKYEHAKESTLAVEDIVFERTLHDDDSDRATYTYVHLGYVPADQTPVPKEHEHSSNDEFSEVPGHDGALRGGVIPCEDILVGYYFNAYPQHLYITKVRAWNFGNVHIGDCINDYEERDFNTEDAFIPRFQPAPYQSFRNHDQLHRHVRGYLNTKPQGDDEHSGIPLRPTYSLNTFDPTQYELGDVEDLEYTDIVCKFICHVDIQYEGDDITQALPYNVQFKIDTRNGAGQIKAHLRKTLLDRSVSPHTRANDKAALRRLFIGEMKNRWRMDLWVLPQGMKKMFQFPTGREGEVDSLTQFLDPNVVHSGERHALALFVEAHLVPIGENEDDVVFERIQEKLPGDEEEEREGGSEGDEGESDLEGGDGDDDEEEPLRRSVGGGRKVKKQTSRKAGRIVWRTGGK